MRIRRRGDRDAAGGAGGADRRAAGASRPERPRPRSWNLWELERLAEGLNGDGADERRLLLLYLRAFADASGHLSVEFDPLVRDAFGARLEELVG